MKRTKTFLTNNWILVASSLILAGFCAVIAQNSRSIGTAMQERVQKRKVVLAVESLVSSIKDAELSERDFLLDSTSDNKTLFYRAKSAILEKFADLYAIAGDDAEWQSRLRAFNVSVDQNLTELATNIETINTKKTVHPGENHLKFGEVRRQGEKLVAEARLRLQQSAKIADRANGFEPTWIVIVGGMAEVLLWAIWLFVIRSNRLAKRSGEPSEESDFSVLAESIPHLVWVMSADGAPLYFNNRWREYTGVEEDYKLHWYAYLHPDDVARVRAVWANSLDSGDSYNVEYRIRNSQGQYRWHLARAVPQVHRSGRVQKWFGTCTDIHEQKRAIENLNLSQNQNRKTQDLLQAILDHSPAVIFIKDTQGHYQLVNKTWEKSFGMVASEALGKTDVQLFNADTAERFITSDQTVIHTGLPSSAEIPVTLGPAGTKTYFSTKFPIRNSGGQLVAVGGISYDITARLVAEAEKSELMVREKAAISASEMKSTFLANMSHEIRTPINGVMGMVNLLLESPLSDEQRSHAGMLKTSAETLLALVNDVLDISKAEAGKIEVESIDFELEQIISEVEQMLGFVARKKGLKFYRTANSELPGVLKGDPTRLRQILVNLVNNSIKFTSSGHVALDVRVEKQTSTGIVLQFEVTDTGLGIPEAAMARLFQAFSQADSSTTRRFGGTGLGLSICKKLVDLMGGEIGVRSAVDRGSTFWFQIPFLTAEAMETRIEGGSYGLNVPTRRMRILLAEDNSVNQLIAVRMLEKMGHLPLAVGNGYEVLDALRNSSFDLILMDCQMPELDGYETTKVIRTNNTMAHATIPIIAMTANALSGDREKCLTAGMNDYVSKPVQPVTLQSAIERATSGQ